MKHQRLQEENGEAEEGEYEEPEQVTNRSGVDPFESDGCIVNPQSDFKVRWDSMMMLLILYSAIMVPVYVAFDTEATGLVWVWEVFVSLVFMADVLISFNTAYQPVGSDEWVVKRDKIAQQYITKGSFIIDAPSSVPVELIEVAFVNANLDQQQSLRILRVFRLFRLFRLLRLLKLRKYIQHIEEEYDINMRSFRIVILVIGLLFLSHLFGCGWLAIAVFAESTAETWITEYRGGVALDWSGSQHYVLAFDWALGTLTSGHRVAVPVTPTEVMYAAFGSLLGALTFGYTLAEIAGLWATWDKQSAMIEERLEAVNEYLRWRKLPRAMGLAVRRYYSKYYETRSVFDEKLILGTLSPELHTQIVTFILDQSVGRVPLFQELNTSFQTAIFPFLKPVQIKKDEVIFERGAGATNMMFLLEGVVSVFNAVDMDKPTHFLRSKKTRFSGTVVKERVYLDNNHMELTVKPWEGCFGQSAITGTKRPAKHVAHTQCEVLVIERSDLVGLFAADANAAARVCKAVLRDDLSEQRHRYIMARLRINGDDSKTAEEKAALVIALAWRRKKEEAAAMVEHDKLPWQLQKLLILHNKRGRKRRVRFGGMKRKGQKNAAEPEASPAANAKGKVQTPTQQNAGSLGMRVASSGAPAGSPMEKLTELSTEVENLAASIQALGDHMAEQEKDVGYKLDQLLKLTMERRVNDMWGGVHA